MSCSAAGHHNTAIALHCETSILSSHMYAIFGEGLLLVESALKKVFAKQVIKRVKSFLHIAIGTFVCKISINDNVWFVQQKFLKPADLMSGC